MARHHSSGPLETCTRAAKLLLELKEVNLDIRDEYGQTLLVLAAKRGYEGPVRLLLGRQGVDLD